MIIFDYPEVFLLAIPLWFAMRRWGWVQGPTGVLRTVIMLLLLFALAIPRLNLAGQGMDIVVVADRSRSMPEQSDQQLRDLIRDLENNRRAGDRISIVTFGSNAEIERELSESAVTNEFTRVIDNDGSDINEALLTALDRRTNLDRPARILLMSDGNYNGASPLYAARRAREENVPVDFREFDKPSSGDLAIDSILLPRETAPNEPFQFSVMVYADRDAMADVVVRRDGVEIARRRADLTLGINRLIFRDWIREGGMHQYSASLVFDDSAAGGGIDPITENNQAAAVVRVVAGRKILLVTHDGQISNVGRALQSARMPFDVVSATATGMTLDELEPYRAVILENVAAGDLGRVRMERLAQFVEDAGGGLMMTGGRQSFGTGGYYKSPLDEILPVAMDSQEETRRSRAAIAVVLDRSGSMTAPVRGGKSKMDLANLGTAECVRMLSPRDMVAVIAVDSAPHVIQPMTAVKSPEAIASRVLRIQSMGGGIFVYTGLVAAGSELMKASDYKTRHIILFSDAADSEEPGDYKQLLKKYANAGITVSVIGLGSQADKDAAFLEDIAQRGSGNFEFTSDPLDLPRLFTQDTMSITRNMFLTTDSEEAPNGFSGRVLPDIQLMGEFAASTLPAVDGYNLTFLKSDASQGVVSTDENTAPFSAFWYRGLGRVVAVPLELDGEYSGNLTSWNAYEDFVITHARWLMGEDDPDDVFVSLAQDGLDAVVQVELDPNRPNKQRGMPPKLVVIPPSQERSEVIEPEFTWTGPDTLEGRFRLEQLGSYRTLVKTAEREFTRGPALTLPYSPEFMPRVGLPSGAETLKSMAEISGGEPRVNVLELYDDIPARSRQLRSLIPFICVLTMVLLAVEIAGRRWGWWDRWAAARRSRAAEQTETVSRRRWRDWFSLPAPRKRRRKQTEPQVSSTSEPATDEPAKKESPIKRPDKKGESDESGPTADVFARAKRRAKDRMK